MNYPQTVPIYAPYPHMVDRKNNTGRPSTKELTNAERIERLEHKIAYLNQENEFLKKIFRWIGRQTGNTSETAH